MSNNYDNWGRLVEVVLRREEDREVALADSRESSFRSISSSSRSGADSSFHEQNPQLEAYNSDTVNLLGDKMVRRRPEAPPRLSTPLRTTLRSYLRNPFSCLTGAARETSSASTNTTIKEVLTNEGKYERHNLYGNLFEVSSKYVPPIIRIGRGAHSLVCAANNKETYERVAIKKIGNPFDNRIDAKRTLREIKLLRHMDHDNIIAIKDIIRPPKKDAFNDVYIVCELMDTDLHQIIQSDQPLMDEHCQYFLYQLLRGLKYVHSANVLHRDLEPSNLLLNANCDLKIGGFGLAGTTSETDFMTEYVFTCYRAPELLLNCSEYTAAIDVWSVGCIIAEILTREPLFPGKDYIEQLKLITELIGTPDDETLEFLRCDNAQKYVMLLRQFPKQQLSARFPNMPPLALDLLEKLLVFDPNQRITVDDALCHPYLSSLHDINEEPICSKPFSFDFEQQAIAEENIKDLIWMESIVFNPDPAH